MLIERDMSIFDSPRGSVLAHGCNTVGVWGAGIAKPFKERFPDTFKFYSLVCKSLPSANLLGKFYPYYEGGYYLGLCMTQVGFGPRGTGPHASLAAIESSLRSLLEYVAKLQNDETRTRDVDVYIPRIGCGYGGLRWEDVRPVIERLAAQYDKVTNIVVCVPKTQGE